MTKKARPNDRGFKVRVRISEVADSADEQVSHGEEDHGFGDVEAVFVVTHEATVAGSHLDKWLPFEPAQVVSLLEAAIAKEDAQLADVIRLGMWTGCRIEESTPTANNKAYTPGQAGGTVFLNGRTSSGRF